MALLAFQRRSKGHDPVTDSDGAMPPEYRETLRKPPHSLEAEQSVLGALLLDNAAVAQAREHLEVADFYSHDHRLIFAAICDLVQAGELADIITVFERLRTQDQADECGGIKYLNGLSLCVPSSASVLRYAEIVRERALLRRLIAASESISTRAFGNESPGDLIDQAKLELKQIESRRLPGANRVPLLDLEALRSTAAAVSWLVKGILPAESIGMLFGGSGTFKSFIALDAGLHIAHGMPWLRKKTRQGPVVYIAAEGGSGLYKRILAWHRQHRIKDWRSTPFYVVPVALDLQADAWRVVEAVQALGVQPAMVVVDTLSQTYAGEENSANEVAAYLRELGARFRSLWQCAVMLLHHSGHLATERPRGSSAMRANLDWMFGVFRDETEMLATLTCAKQKDSEPFADLSFNLLHVELGADEDGDTVGSLVAHHVCDPEEMREIVAEQISRGRKGYAATLVDLAKDGMTEKELRAAFYEACDLGNSDSKSKAYRRAFEWAKKSGVLGVVNGRVQIFRQI